MNSHIRSRIRTPSLMVAGVLMASTCLSGCSSPRDGLDEFAHWQDKAVAQAEAGLIRWSELYQQSFDRLAALPPSLQQDSRLEQTVLLLSNAQKYEAAEISAQQFNTERQLIEQRQLALLR